MVEAIAAEPRQNRRSSRVSFCGDDDMKEFLLGDPDSLSDDKGSVPDACASKDSSKDGSFSSRREASSLGTPCRSDGKRSRRPSILSTRSSSYGNTRSSIIRRRSSIDTSKKNDGSILIDDRESHTVDLDAFDRWVSRLEKEDRDERDPAFDSSFWDFLRGILEEHARPIGFGPEEAGTFAPKGPDDAMAFLMKKFVLDDVSPINPTVLANKAGLPLDAVLCELLYATSLGACSLKFVPQCIRCGGAVCDVGKLGLLSGKIDCRGCLLENDIHSLDDICVAFFLNPEILYVLADGFGCNPSKASMAATEVMAPIPGTTTCSGFRYSVGCGDKPMREEPLPKGLYRMHCLIASTDNWLEIEGDAPSLDDESKSEVPKEVVVPFKISEFKIHDPEQERKTIKVPHGRMHFDVTPDTYSLMALWIQRNVGDEVVYTLPKEERAPYTSAAVVINHPLFNRMYPAHDTQILSVSRGLQMSNVVLVFTDVVGSTDMYATLGDMTALSLVEKHFEVLFAAFSRYGRIVKTIGDAVMASFTTGRGALEAVAYVLSEIGEACIRPDGKPFEIRVGVHAGPAVVTPLNSLNDYFGQTVNVAARVEAKADASSCLISESVFADPDAAAAYDDIITEAVELVEVPEVKLKLKGVKGTVRAKGFQLAEELRGPIGKSEGKLNFDNRGAKNAIDVVQRCNLEPLLRAWSR